ncbi:hypothetical protein HCU74_08145 [Spongiibacter sp. KMU-166]|uniref:Uncharacterized protein n=1 Tax=Spongiibacter thalassae TaxID=2721624 RepID=A0ABX1GEK7_9GAMM|nr:hypothetical protein [Spongiibacter thalassae]NKI17385.1 hypothetical protein [Spongiibacter thalassae]
MAIVEKLKTGELARLVPTLPDSKKEERATSVLLSIFRVVPSFAKDVLELTGASVGARARVECYTEVTFKGDALKGIRPDGLIVVYSGKKEWSALVESKIGNAGLKPEQVESYAQAVKQLGADAFVTISNEFAALPTHHPVEINKALAKKVNIFHFSWLSLICKAILLSENKVVDDPEQAYLLAEMIRYFNSPNSGVSAFTRMGPGWREVCDRVQQGAPLQGIQQDVENAIGSWLQLMKFLSLRLSIATASAVQLVVQRRFQDDAPAQQQELILNLTKSNCLDASLTVPNAAAPLDVSADFARRVLSVSMKLQSPQDIKRPTAAINWLTRQLKDVKDKASVTVRVHWPKRIAMTVASLELAHDKPELLIPENCKEIPKELEVVIVVDLAGKFRGSQTFVDESENGLKFFYKTIGQKLTKWQPKAPEIKKKERERSSINVTSGAFSEEADRLELTRDSDEDVSSEDIKVVVPPQVAEDSADESVA